MEGSAAGLPELVGGILCLDFVNTVDDRLDARPVDWLSSYAALLAWCRHSGALGAEEEAHLGTLARSRGDAALARARTVRESLHAVLAALAERAPVPAADLATVDGALAELLGPPVLRMDGADVRVMTAGDAHLDMDTPLRRVLRSLIDLLGGDRVHLLRRCAAPDCSFLFVDTTRSHNRKWCRSGGCGTRNRFRRHYARHRKRAEREEPHRPSPR